MEPFYRGIDQAFVDALNNDSHVQTMVNDKDLFIGIRKDSVHVYYYGQRICEITYVKSKSSNIKELKFISHNTYLDKPNDGYSETGAYLEDIEKLKSNAFIKRQGEKEQVKINVLDKKYTILDVEVTFGKTEIIKKSSIDFVKIEKKPNGDVKLYFYEAKLHSNKEIKKEGNNIPDIVKQMDRYEKILANPKIVEELKDSYRKVIDNIAQLNLNPKLIALIGNKDLKIEIASKPNLLVFMMDKPIDSHIKKLQEKYADRLEIL